jgi:flagellar biosynthesis protein FlhF
LETKRFIGNDMERIYDRVRKDFGPDAVIVRTRSLLREGAEPLIEVLAAPPQAEPELALDMQWTMVDGALGRLQIARPRATVGDLEDMVAAEALSQARLPAPQQEFHEQPAPEWMEGFVDAPGHHTGARMPDARSRRFAPLPESDPDAPPNDWAMQERPARRVQRPAARPDTAAAAPEPRPQPSPFRRPRVVAGTEPELVAAGLSIEAAAIVTRAQPGRNAFDALAAHLDSLEPSFPAEGVTALITVQGPAGTGRTTSLMRMALDCADSGREVVLIAADSTRAAAREMLHAYGDATGLAVLDGMTPDSFENALAAVPPGACAFADVPAGRFAMEVPRTVRQYTYLALPATWQSAALSRAIEAFDLASAAGCVLTFTDAATDLSPILSLVIESGLAVTFLSSGRDISTGITGTDGRDLASGILTTPTRETTDGRRVASA